MTSASALGMRPPLACSNAAVTLFPAHREHADEIEIDWEQESDKKEMVTGELHGRYLSLYLRLCNGTTWERRARMTSDMPLAEPGLRTVLTEMG
jgi:hypothetical protein